jgi:hypothetical protein
MAAGDCGRSGPGPEVRLERHWESGNPAQYSPADQEAFAGGRGEVGNDDGSPDDLSSERRLPLRSGGKSPGTDGDGNSAAAAEVDGSACSGAMAQGSSGTARDHAGAGRNASRRLRAGSRAAGLFSERILRPRAGAASAASAVWQDGPLGLDAMGVPARGSSSETVWPVARAGGPERSPRVARTETSISRWKSLAG